VVAAGFMLTGCGGLGSSSSKSSDVTSGRFEQHGFEITFRYPQSLKDADDLILGQTAGAADTARAGVGINRDNVILITRYDLRRPVTKSNVAAVQPEVDGVIKGLAGREFPGRSVMFGGLPGYQYRVPLQAPQGGSAGSSCSSTGLSSTSSTASRRPSLARRSTEPATRRWARSSGCSSSVPKT
jgi:hypothetical protein